MDTKDRAVFLYTPVKGCIEEAGWKFANAANEDIAKCWWEILVLRIRMDEGREIKELLLKAL